MLYVIIEYLFCHVKFVFFLSIIIVYFYPIIYHLFMYILFIYSIILIIIIIIIIIIGMEPLSCHLNGDFSYTDLS